MKLTGNIRESFKQSGTTSTRTHSGDHQNHHDPIYPFLGVVFLFSGDFQPVLAMKFLVESEFQGQGPPRTQETTKTTGTIRTPRVGFGTGGPYIALLGPTFRDLPVLLDAGFGYIFT